jgi:hypothetical protein
VTGVTDSPETAVFLYQAAWCHISDFREEKEEEEDKERKRKKKRRRRKRRRRRMVVRKR